MNESLKKYLEAAESQGDRTLDDAAARLTTLDGSEIGVMIADYYTPADELYQEVSEHLPALIAQVGGQTPIGQATRYNCPFCNG